MRPFLFTLLFFSACGLLKKKDHSSNQALNGIWRPIREEIAGTKIPPIAFQSQTLELKNGHYIMTAESVDQGEYQVHANTMDIYGKEGVNAGKHLKARFELKNEQLTICYDLDGKSYPETFETKNHPFYFTLVLERKK